MAATAMVDDTALAQISKTENPQVSKQLGPHSACEQPLSKPCSRHSAELEV